ncbi:MULTISPECIES: hypothetical protein [Brenneria]|uniref:DUF2570 domain-containing protein n=1 Tax=Brenneria nigrifluens DSM 30175 = ATCC 13028 TaxID=1121120 RepID=A0A2U1UUR0_9GAMM|nr:MULTISPECIES: hypothetical protein [Brenneria]EHD22063.1 hypothetical protein BrE312_2686 [Brenneria sp. EniD312]PWC25393.1 hypothetical protein DDT54_05725 [Brenneria nigrifluens DSM 30175 = ATCC 13028]QCR05144.1 hypothetical protein EH206_13685 [Brenneria nigrifluens DSM 30175 = ATCC 13028]
MPWQIIAKVIIVMLALAAIVGSGAWLAARHYQPAIDNLNEELTQCQGARRQQDTTITVQNNAVTALQVLADLRAADAEKAKLDAQREAQGDYAAANTVLAEQTQGDACMAASSAFDDELRRERSK